MRRRTSGLLLAVLLAGCPAPPTSTGGKPATPRPTGGPSAAPAIKPTSSPAGTPSSAPSSAAPSSPEASAAPSPAPSASGGAPFETAPLTRFHALYGFDAVRNWVPGEIMAGPLHVNRGPVAADAVGVDATTPGRSVFVVHSDRVGFRPMDGRDRVRFDGPVSLTRTPADAPVDAANLLRDTAWFQVHPTSAEAQAGAVTVDAATLARIFTHRANARGLGDRPGPIFVDRQVPLPGPFAGRLGPALGLAAGASPTDLAWWKDLPDGVYVPTRDLADGKATAYAAGAAPAGGIYVRGTVEVLRAAVKGAVSYYLFQVGHPGSEVRRVYGVRVDRAGGSVTLIARPAGPVLATQLADVGGDPEGLFAYEAAGATDLAAWGLAGADGVKLALASPAGRPAFNGVIAVDHSIDDPLRDPMDKGRLLPAAATERPLTGHVLALGDPQAGAKQALAGASAALPAELRAAEVFATDVPADAAATTGLTIMAAGSIFVQNHVVVAGLASAIGAPTDAAALAAGLEAKGAALAAARDRLMLWADGRVVFGLAAPSVPDFARPGLVVTASVLGLEDPDRLDAPRDGEVYPRSGPPHAYAGSIVTEGIMPLFNVAEDFGLAYGPPPLRAWWRPDGGYGTGLRNPVNEPDEAVLAGAGAPNAQVRGQLVLFGSLIAAKRGITGAGNRSYRMRHLHDPRLGALPPPLVP